MPKILTLLHITFTMSSLIQTTQHLGSIRFHPDDISVTLCW